VTNRALVTYGDTTDVRTWSNIPYFFLQAGVRNGLFKEGVILRPEGFRLRRLLWNASRPLVLDAPRGFMYSREYLEDLWEAREAPEDVGEYVSHYQLLPPRNLVAEPISYYMDATMRQYFDDYDYRIGRRVRTEAMAREQEAYDAARFVVCMSEWCAEDVRASYGVSGEKVKVILPGANLDEGAVTEPLPWDGSFSPLRLGIVGFHWERKGGPLLLEVLDTLRRRGLDVELVVLGPPASAIPRHPAVRALGYVDKTHELPRFVEIVRTFHFGCLLSSAEALGIAPLEFLRLGVPPVVTAVGGIEDPREAGIRLAANASSEEIADEIEAVVRDPERYARMRAAAARAGEYYSWDRTVREFLALLEPAKASGSR
jgi:glycosyltransferase involved in cell wall biosynthesis